MIRYLEGIPPELNWKAASPCCRNVIGTTAALIAGGLAAAGGIGGSLISSSGVKSAAKTQKEAAQYAADIQKEMYEQNREDLSPWRQAGSLSLDRLNALLGLSGEPTAAGYGSLTEEYPSFTGTFTAPTLTDDPGYQARLAEGLKSVERSAAARSGTLSGAAAKEMARYGQTYASNEYSNAFNRAVTKYNADLGKYNTNFNTFNTNQGNLYNRLQTLAGMGENAAGQTAALGSASAGNIGNYATQSANATAAGQVGSSNAWSSGLGDIFNNLQQLYLLSKMKNVNPASLSGSGYSV